MVAVAEKEETDSEARFRRVKQLRYDGYTFAAMIPTLIKEGYLPEHVKHGNEPARTKGGRTAKRNAEICSRCENAVSEQWRRLHARLREDEPEVDEQRWKWFRDQEWIVEQCRTDYRQRVVITTTKRKQVEPIPGSMWTVRVKLDNGEVEQRLYPAESIEGIAEIVETTERVEHRIYPQLLELMSEVRDKVARVAGVAVDEVGDPDAERESTGAPRGLRVTVPAGWGDRDGRGNGPPAN